MGDGVKLAIAILILFLAMVAFFFAFHPNGVEGANNPQDVLNWMFGQFDTESADPGTFSQSSFTPDTNFQLDLTTGKAISGVTAGAPPGAAVLCLEKAEHYSSKAYLFQIDSNKGDELSKIAPHSRAKWAAHVRRQQRMKLHAIQEIAALQGRPVPSARSIRHVWAVNPYPALDYWRQNSSQLYSSS